MIQENLTQNCNWYHLQYSPFAPVGLPPIIQAESVMRYRDETGTWLVALWATAGANGDGAAACILRIPSDQVVTVTRYQDMGQAAASLNAGRAS